MSWLRNLPVPVKLLTGFGLLATITIVVGWLGVHNLGILTDTVRDLYEDEMQPSLEVADLRTLLRELRSNTWQLLAVTDADKSKMAVTEAYDLHRRVRKEEEDVLPKIRSPELREKFQEARAAMGEYIRAREELIIAPVEIGRASCRERVEDWA